MCNILNYIINIYDLRVFFFFYADLHEGMKQRYVEKDPQSKHSSASLLGFPRSMWVRPKDGGPLVLQN